MTLTEEAAAILIRVFESLARTNGKTLKPQTRADIERACELLVGAGAELDDLLDDVPSTPRVSPAEAAVNFVDAARADPNYQAWKRQRERTDQ